MKKDNAFTLAEVFHPVEQSKRTAFTLAEVFHPAEQSKKTAFTLAEVLITLSIIGVVAALTMPSLIQKHKEKTTVTRLKKAYSTISNAHRLAVSEHGQTQDWGLTKITVDDDRNVSENTFTNMDLFWDKLLPYMNYSSYCRATDSNCASSAELFYFLDGSPRKGYSYANERNSIITLNDGTSILGGWYVNERGMILDFAIDTNGIKNPPNTVGKDIFYFVLKKNNIIIPQGTPEYRPFASFCDKSKKEFNLNGYGCAAWVIQYENLDYLHCDDLSWNGKHKCKK